MSQDKMPTVIELTPKQAQEHLDAVLAETPYATPGQLRWAVFNGGEQCCSNCYDYSHPHAEAWSRAWGWLYLLDKNWRTVE